MKEIHNLEIDAVEDHLEVINALDGRISKLQREIRDISSEMEENQILMTIPGVSYYSALTIIAEIATVERFPSSGHLCSYAGLTPSVTQSGSKETHGSIQGGRPITSERPLLGPAPVQTDGIFPLTPYIPPIHRGKAN